MTKIYFAPNWGLSAEDMVACYIKQSPKESGSWGKISHTTDLNKADYLIIEDECTADVYNKFPADKRLYFSREALDPNSHNNYKANQVKKFSFWDGSGYLYTKWIYPREYGGINMTYDKLLSDQEPNKIKNISCIQTNKEITTIHKARQVFIKKYMSRYDIDVYGTISCANRALENNDKKNALDEYKYCLTFDNQTTIKNFFGTQVTDALLRWTVPIYGGGGELERYFPKKSFIKIDPTDLNDIDRVHDLIKNDNFNDRREAIAQARDLIINKYNVWPTIEALIK